VGLLQARRERKHGLQVPGVVAEYIVGEWRASAWCGLSHVGICRSCRVWCLGIFPCLLPCGKGVRPPFIDQGRSESHARRAI
jgi:hypothetical protein